MWLRSRQRLKWPTYDSQVISSYSSIFSVIRRHKVIAPLPKNALRKPIRFSLRRGGVQALILKGFFVLPKYNPVREVRHKTVPTFLNCGKRLRNNFCNRSSSELLETRDAFAWNAPIADTKKTPSFPLKVKTQPALLPVHSDVTRQTGNSSLLTWLLRLHRFPWKIPRVFIMRACLIFDIFQTIDPWKPNVSIPRKTSAKIF